MLAWEPRRLKMQSLVWRVNPFPKQGGLNIISEPYKCVNRFLCWTRLWLELTLAVWNEESLPQRCELGYITIIYLREKKIRSVWFEVKSERLIPLRTSAFITISVGSLSLLPATWWLSCVAYTPTVRCQCYRKTACQPLNLIFTKPSCHPRPTLLIAGNLHTITKL